MSIDAQTIARRALRYLATPAVIGFEAPFVDLLHEELESMGHRVERQRSVLAAVGGPATVSAHVDRHGFVVGEEGALLYAASALAGRPPSASLKAAICRRSDEESVYAYDPASGAALAEATIDHSAHCNQGPELRAAFDAFRGLPLGTPVAFAARGTMDGKWLRGQIDNTISVALAMEHLAHGFDGTVLFTLGEEAGRSWEGLASWFDGEMSDLIVLDTSPFDSPDPAEDGVVVLRHADSGATFHPDTTRRLAIAAAAIPIVWKDEYLADAGRPLGRSELGRLVTETGGRVTGSTLQVPTADYHTNHEATTLSAIQAAADVLMAMSASERDDRG